MRPTIARSPPNCFRQNPYDRTTTRSRPRWLSPGSRSRPAAGTTLKTLNRSGVAMADAARTTSPSSRMTKCQSRYAPKYATVRLARDQSSRLRGETVEAPPFVRFTSAIETMRSASENGNGRSSTASTTANTAVVAPTPSATVTMATSVKRRSLIRPRQIWRGCITSLPMRWAHPARVPRWSIDGAGRRKLRSHRCRVSGSGQASLRRMKHFR